MTRDIVAEARARRTPSKPSVVRIHPDEAGRFNSEQLGLLVEACADVLEKRPCASAPYVLYRVSKRWNCTALIESEDALRVARKSVREFRGEERR